MHAKGHATKTLLGHSLLAATEIYTAACGPEQVFFLERFWRASDINADQP
jgi:hypothetical protein